MFGYIWFYWNTWSVVYIRCLAKYRKTFAYIIIPGQNNIGYCIFGYIWLWIYLVYFGNISSIKGQLGVPLTVYPWCLLRFVGILGDEKTHKIPTQKKGVHPIWCEIARYFLVQPSNAERQMLGPDLLQRRVSAVREVMGGGFWFLFVGQYSILKSLISTCVWCI